MTGRLDWRRATPRRPTESKYGNGVTLDNGARTIWIPPDNLARKADAALKEWLQTLHPRDRAKVAP
jgi:hypothetical protein